MRAIRALLLALLLVFMGVATRADAAPTPTGWWTAYSGKPSAPLTVRPTYTYIGTRTPTPRRSGIETHLLYLNLRPTFATPADPPGVCRVKYVRDAHRGRPRDSTGYTDYTISPGNLIGGSFTITHVHEERGQAGRNGRWYVRCRGFAQVTAGTRYEKVSVAW